MPKLWNMDKEPKRMIIVDNCFDCPDYKKCRPKISLKRKIALECPLEEYTAQ